VLISSISIYTRDNFEDGDKSIPVMLLSFLSNNIKTTINKHNTFITIYNYLKDIDDYMKVIKNIINDTKVSSITYTPGIYSVYNPPPPPPPPPGLSSGIKKLNPTLPTSSTSSTSTSTQALVTPPPRKSIFQNFFNLFSRSSSSSSSALPAPPPPEKKETSTDTQVSLEPICIPSLNMDKPVGLKQISNNCYINSVVQVLSVTPEFTLNFIIFVNNKKSIFSQKTNEPATNILKSLSNLIETMESNKSSNNEITIDPTEFIEVLHNAAVFTRNQCNDPFEFLVYLFRNVIKLKNIQYNVTANFEHMDCNTYDSYLKGKNFIIRDFLIIRKNDTYEDLQVVNIGNVSKSFAITVNIYEKTNLYKLLHDTLYENYLCKVPTILIIKLDAVRNDINEHKRFECEVPQELYMSNYVKVVILHQQGRIIFDLYAAIIYTSNHYITLIKQGETWYYINDSYVCACSNYQDIINKSAHLLFFRKR
jgi:hypothetical protein